MPVKTYSSGMYTRLGFSVAMHMAPDILLLDEVLAVGDEAFQQKCYGKIWDFKRAGGTIVFVSHDPHAVELLCDRAILLERGPRDRGGQRAGGARRLPPPARRARRGPRAGGADRGERAVLDRRACAPATAPATSARATSRASRSRSSSSCTRPEGLEERPRLDRAAHAGRPRARRSRDGGLVPAARPSRSSSGSTSSRCRCARAPSRSTSG